MAAILEVSGLKKAYKNFELKNVSFSIHEDCITGFIGVNGAGKTTTINALLNLIHRDGGIVKFRGKDISTDEKTFKDKIGVVFDSGCFYDELTIKDMTALLAPAYSEWDDHIYKPSILFSDCKSLSNMKQYPRIVTDSLRDWRRVYGSLVESGIRGYFHEQRFTK